MEIFYSRNIIFWCLLTCTTTFYDEEILAVLYPSQSHKQWGSLYSALLPPYTPVEPDIERDKIIDNVTFLCQPHTLSKINNHALHIKKSKIYVLYIPKSITYTHFEDEWYLLTHQPIDSMKVLLFYLFHPHKVSWLHSGVLRNIASQAKWN